MDVEGPADLGRHVLDHELRRQQVRVRYRDLSFLHERDLLLDLRHLLGSTRVVLDELEGEVRRVGVVPSLRDEEDPERELRSW